MECLVDLMMDTGQLVRIECPEEQRDELYDSLHNAMTCGDSWSPARVEGCTAEYLGVQLDAVNMRRVVGTL